MADNDAFVNQLDPAVAAAAGHAFRASYQRQIAEKAEQLAGVEADLGMARATIDILRQQLAEATRPSATGVEARLAKEGDKGARLVQLWLTGDMPTVDVTTLTDASHLVIIPGRRPAPS